MDRRQNISRKQWIIVRMGFTNILWFALTSDPQLLYIVYVVDRTLLWLSVFFFCFFFASFYVVVMVFWAVAYWPKLKKSTTKCWYNSGPYIWLWALSQCKSMGFLGPLYCPPVINLIVYEIYSKQSPQKYTYKHTSIMLGCFARQETLTFCSKTVIIY